MAHLAAARAAAPIHVISVRSDRALPDDASRWADVVRPDRPRRRRATTGPARVHGAYPAVPRHGLQLPAAPVHADGWADRADVQVGPCPRARAHRARRRHELLRRAHDEPRAAAAPGLG